MATKTIETLTGEFSSVRWRKEGDESGFLIGMLADKTPVLGNDPGNKLLPGLSYEFEGYWANDEKFGRQFKFEQLKLLEPHSQYAIISYLERFAPHCGPVMAQKLYDAFGCDAVKVLRAEPQRAADLNIRGFTLEKCQESSKVLQQISLLEDTRISLVELFRGRHFPGTLVDECIKKWGILAPERIRRDPYTLLVNDMPGCGFARCDRLYTDLGLPPSRTKRQTICLWHILHEDTSGNTWMLAELAVIALDELLSRCDDGGPGSNKREKKIKKAIMLGVRSRWIAKKRDDAGQLWLAEGERARAERTLAKRLIELQQETVWKESSNGDESVDAETGIEGEVLDHGQTVA